MARPDLAARPGTAAHLDAAERAFAAASVKHAPLPTRTTDWLTSALLLAAITAALGGLTSVLTGIHWWFVAVAAAAIVLLAAAVARSLARNPLWGTLCALAAAIATLTSFFASDTAILGFIPTPDTFGAFHDLQRAAGQSISEQTLPADADGGIVYLICIGVVTIAFAADTFAFAARTPALTGLPLGVLLLVPTLVTPTLSNALVFALTAAAWLGVLLVQSRRATRQGGLALAAVALGLALVVPLALPSVEPGRTANGAGGVAVLNPILTLGEDLRRGDPTLALTYNTTVVGGEYLRLVALDDFTGRSWFPSSGGEAPRTDVAKIDGPTGVGEGVATVIDTTFVSVAGIQSRWLPVPYAPTKVTGLTGDWSWRPDALALRTEASSAGNQQYEVISTRAVPSVEQLNAAGTVVDPAFARYLDVPADLPPVVAQTAQSVTAGRTTFYEKAVALQAYFTGGQFTYSVDAPVAQGYDGSGAQVLGQFLEAKSGYCVHFSSAMAAMARTLGIPARVAVGFVPGETVTVGSQLVEHRVTTDDFHAWPELYFEGIGWVRFEPTPGRGVAPAFAPLNADDPSTPNIDESVPPAPTAAPTSSAAPTPVPSSSARPNLPVDDGNVASASAAAAASAAPWWIGLGALALALLVAPGLVRIARRRSRLRAVAGGSAASAWDELRDTAIDLGLRPMSVAVGDALTPRQATVELGAPLGDDGAAALARLRDALERESFAGRPGNPALADVRRVLGSLRVGAGLWRSVVATVLPRSLVARLVGVRDSAVVGQ